MSLKKTNKRAPTNVFDSTTIDDRLEYFSRFKTEGDWRHVERKKLVITVLIQKVDTHSQWKDSRDEASLPMGNV